MVQTVGIIGTGFGASFHLPAFQEHDYFRVKGISGRDMDKTTQIADKASIKPFESWKEMVQDPDIDVISIATPPYLHHEMGKLALEHAKHILLEKPTALHGSQADELMKLAESNHLQGILSHEWRYYSFNQYLHKLLHEDQIVGDIELIRAQDLLPYAYKKKYSWQHDRELGGGWIGIAGSHIVDLIRFLTDLEFTSIRGDHGIRYPVVEDREETQREVTAEDYFTSLFTMEGSISGVIDHIPTLSPAPPSRLIISGTEGTIYTEGRNILIPEQIYHSVHESEFKSISLPTNPHPIGSTGIGPVMHDLFQLLLDEFEKALIGESFHAPTLEDGCKNQVVLDCIKASQSSRGEVVLS